MNNLKLCVEVVGAHNLLPKDGKGSSSPFVELNFDGQRTRTTIKEKDLSPVWNESFYFNIADADDLQYLLLDAYVYNSVKAKSYRSRSFLGKTSLKGDSFLPYSDDVVVHPCPLEKSGVFSRVRGNLDLKVYVTYHEPLNRSSSATPVVAFESIIPVHSSLAHAGSSTQGDSYLAGSTTSPNAEEETKHTSHRLPDPSDDAHQRRPPSALTQAELTKYDFTLKETSPNPASTSDLVEQMQFLYVKVVKARNLPVIGIMDPFVEVRVGPYKVITKVHENQKNPVWNEMFAFSVDDLEASVVLKAMVMVKDNQGSINDDFEWSVCIDIDVVKGQVPSASTRVPQWYKLQEKTGKKIHGELMLAVWMHTQADDAFSEAWHYTPGSPLDSSLVDSSVLRSKVYHLPSLWYLRVNVIEARDLFSANNAYVKLDFGKNMRKTKAVQDQNLNPFWNEEFLFVITEPIEYPLCLTVEDRVAADKVDILGMVEVDLSTTRKRVDDSFIPSRWYNLVQSAVAEDADHQLNEKFSSRIHLRICREEGYHVSCESTLFASDLRPTSEQLWRPSIGVLELGILTALGLRPMKTGNRRGTSDTYCVAKYSNKWFRTRTVVGDLSPRYNEQCTWEVFDTATVLTVGVFDNSLQLGDNQDLNIGKVRLRISSLEPGRIYSYSYPLLVLDPTGVTKGGELHLAIRFSCTSWFNMLRTYSQPQLPKMNYLRPLPVVQIDMLRHNAVEIIAAQLGRADPSLGKEVVEYMFAIGSNHFSMRRSKAHFFRVMSCLSALIPVAKWFSDICEWKNPLLTVLVHVLFLMLVCFPELIFPTAFLYVFLRGLWNFRFRPRHPLHFDTRLSHADSIHPDELDEEFDAFPTSRPEDIVRMRYDRLRAVAGRVQTEVGAVATQGERILALLSWRDFTASALFITLSLVAALVMYWIPFKVVLALAGFFKMMHPSLRKSLPSAGLLHFFKRLPSKIDSML